MQASARRQQYLRRSLQGGFFLLFLLAPALDLFRFDLTLGHAILFGMPWTLGLDDFVTGRIGPTQAAVNVLLRGFLPLLLAGGTLIGIAWARTFPWWSASTGSCSGPAASQACGSVKRCLNSSRTGNGCAATGRTGSSRCRLRRALPYCGRSRC
jgi:hypothetical protein